MSTAIFILQSASCLFSQTVFEPINSGVYQFLDIMAQKGLITFNDEIRPVSRKYIAGKLLQLKIKNEKLKNEEFTSVERDELNFYIQDFGMEIKQLHSIKTITDPMTDNDSNKPPTSNPQPPTSNLQPPTSNLQPPTPNPQPPTSNLQPPTPNPQPPTSNPQPPTPNLQPPTPNPQLPPPNPQPPTNHSPQTTILNYDPYGRLRLFSYEDSLFKVNAGPILGYEAGTRDGAKYSHRWDGVYIYGYLGSNLGFSFRFKDNSEDGTAIDRTKQFSPQTGIIIAKSDLNNIQYSEVNADITYDWSYGDITLGKDFFNWGYGQSGLLVLSDKAPSFPFIRLDIRPVKWLRFNYIHAWLNSDVIDSSGLYPTYLPGAYRDRFRSKYLASHTLTVTPVEGLDLSVGESIVYGDKLEIPYLIPIMFFRLADHYLSGGSNNAGGNSQFFFGVSSRNEIKNTHLYGTLFIDEITLEGLFNPEKQRNQLGFTLGGSVTDLPVDNLTLTAEYTKIYPFVYSHYIPTLTYQSSGYVLGHWMGNNADLIYGAMNYRFIRGLQATVWGQYIRKGPAGSVEQQYTQPQPPFLFGLRTDYAYFGADIKYEIIHDLYAKLHFQTTKISAEQPDLTFSYHRVNEFYLGIYYGIL